MSLCQKWKVHVEFYKKKNKLVRLQWCAFAEDVSCSSSLSSSSR